MITGFVEFYPAVGEKKRAFAFFGADVSRRFFSLNSRLLGDQNKFIFYDYAFFSQKIKTGITLFVCHLFIPSFSFGVKNLMTQYNLNLKLIKPLYNGRHYY
jgi:hypothetical protein